MRSTLPVNPAARELTTVDTRQPFNPNRPMADQPRTTGYAEAPKPTRVCVRLAGVSTLR
jgi:hypothetical protein